MTVVGEMSVGFDLVPSGRHQQSNLKSPLGFGDKSYPGPKVIHGKNQCVGLVLVSHFSHDLELLRLLTSCS